MGLFGINAPPEIATAFAQVISIVTGYVNEGQTEAQGLMKRTVLSGSGPSSLAVSVSGTSMRSMEERQTTVWRPRLHKEVS